jgi:hypothetical protein
MPSFYMHYESNCDDFVLPIEEIQDASLIGETDMNNSNSLAHAHSDENQVFDRGKSL